MPKIDAKIVRRKCPVIAAFKPSGEAVLIPCGLWTCPRCSKLLARKWARRVRLHIEANPGEWWFLTLTFGSSYRTPTQAFAAMPRLWDSLRKQMKRKYPNWQFMAFVEGQAKNRGGMPHFHIVSNQHPPSERGKRGQWTKRGVHDWAVERGFGFEADASPVDTHEAAAYVSKYASKGDPSMPRKFRRVRASQGWTKTPKNPAKTLIVPAKGESLVAFLIRVQEHAEVGIDELYERWRKAQDDLIRANRDPDDDPDA